MLLYTTKGAAVYKWCLHYYFFAINTHVLVAHEYSGVAQKTSKFIITYPTTRF